MTSTQRNDSDPHNDNSSTERPVMTHDNATIVSINRQRTNAPTSVTTKLIYAGLAALAVAAFLLAGCESDFDPASLVEGTRVIGARVEVDGAPNRASPAPGETATVTWLVTAPGAMPPLGWAFALCVPEGPGKLGCAGAPLSVYQGTDSPPRVSFAVPATDVLGGTTALVMYGRVCANGMPTLDARGGFPGCTDGADGVTVSVNIRVQSGTDANHNPVADRGFMLDGQPWPQAAGTDACATGPRVAAGTDDHVIAATTSGSDREVFTALVGDPPVPTPGRESLQVSQFTTAGKLKVPYSFVEATDGAPETPVEVKWNAPKFEDVTAATPVTFTFVVRDGRGGIDWTTRTACVDPG